MAARDPNNDRCADGALPVLTADAIAAEIQRRLEPARRAPRERSMGLGDQYLDLIPRLVCADGLSLSVQTGFSHYCTPRDGRGPWSTVEIGFPTRRVEALMPHIDGGEDEDPTDTVYGYVPLHTVALALAEAGGLMPEGTPDPAAASDGALERQDGMAEAAPRDGYRPEYALYDLFGVDPDYPEGAEYRVVFWFDN